MATELTPRQELAAIGIAPPKPEVIEFLKGLIQ